MIKGVITGDLVNSTHIAAEWRQTVGRCVTCMRRGLIPLTPVKFRCIGETVFKWLLTNLNMH